MTTWILGAAAIIATVAFAAALLIIGEQQRELDLLLGHGDDDDVY